MEQNLCRLFSLCVLCLHRVLASWKTILRDMRQKGYHDPNSQCHETYAHTAQRTAEVIAYMQNIASADDISDTADAMHRHLSHIQKIQREQDVRANSLTRSLNVFLILPLKRGFGNDKGRWLYDDTGVGCHFELNGHLTRIIHVCHVMYVVLRVLFCHLTRPFLAPLRKRGWPE